MDVILLEHIQNVGELGDQVKVKPGFARNYLIPQKKAVPATTDAKHLVEQRRQQLAQLNAERLDASKARAALLARSVTVTRRAGEEGKLFGSVTQADVAEALSAAGPEVHKSEIQMPDGPFKHTGEFQLQVQIHLEVVVEVILIVLAEQD